MNLSVADREAGGLEARSRKTPSTEPLSRLEIPAGETSPRRTRRPRCGSVVRDSRALSPSRNGPRSASCSQPRVFRSPLPPPPSVALPQLPRVRWPAHGEDRHPQGEALLMAQKRKRGGRSRPALTSRLEELEPEAEGEVVRAPMEGSAIDLGNRRCWVV
jgi:hypothetical protein